MSVKQRRKPAYVVIVLIILHLLFSYFATAPAAFNNSRAQYWSGLYTMPFLKQNWKLFGPEVPSNNYEIVLTFEHGNSVEVIESFRDDFKLSLFSKYGNTALGLQTWCELLEYEILNRTGNYYSKSSNHLFHSLAQHLFEDEALAEALILKNGEIIYVKRYD